MQTHDRAPLWRRLSGLLALTPGTALGVLMAFGSGRTRRDWRRAPGVWLVASDRGLAHWFLTRRGYAAITLGRLVIATRPLTPAERRHESAHLDQFRELGWRFLPLYLFYQWRHGYADNPLEVGARAAEASGPDYLPPDPME